MRGVELRAARQRVGATHQHIAQATGLRPSEVERWELFGEVPRKHRFAVELVLWKLECEQALASSDLPECERARDWGTGTGPVDGAAVARHAAECPVCRVRDAYVREHVRPIPIGGTPLMRVHALVDRLDGWARSAAAGAALLLLMGGGGVVLMLVQAILRQDMAYAWLSAGLFALLVASGAAGGTMHYLTAPLRGKGTLGYYGSYALTVQTYLLAVFGIVILSVRAAGGTSEDLSQIPSLAEPAFWMMLLIMGVVFGVVLGRALRDDVGDERPRRERTPPQRRVFTGRNLAVALLLLSMGVGLAFLSRETEPTTPEQWQALLPNLKVAAEKKPDDPKARGRLAWALLNLSHFDEARPELREAVRLNPKDADLINALGWVDMNEGDLTGSIALFRNALELNPDHYIARQNLGWAYYRTGRLEEAEQAYREVLRVNPENAVALATLGRILIQARRLPLAEEAFRQAILLDPANPENHRGLARALMQNGQPQPALESLYAATRLAPDDTLLWYEIGRLAHIIGKYDESVLGFERVHQLDPAVFDNVPEANALWEASRRGQPYEPPDP